MSFPNRFRGGVLSASVTLLALLPGCETTPTPPPPAPAASQGQTMTEREQSGALDVGKLDQAPVARFQVPPMYPAALRSRGVEGVVLIDFVVDPNGDVRQAKALSFPHEGLGAAAVEAVARWKFRPGMKNGRPVYVHLQVPITFVARPVKH